MAGNEALNDIAQALEAIADQRSEAAFRLLVDRYMGLVFSACFRQLKDRHLAEDGAQAVFLLLSQKSASLRADRLSGWLLTTSRYVCANIRKSDYRRIRREKGVAMNPQTAATSQDQALLELLDQGLDHVNPVEREALVLRYLREESVEAVATSLCISVAAARKRIDRGLEKLRGFFSRNGVQCSSAIITEVIAQHVRENALTPIAKQLISEGIFQVFHAGASSSAVSVSIAKGVQTMLFFNKVKIVSLVVVVLSVLGTGGWIVSQSLAAAPVVAQASPIAPPIAKAEKPATKPATTARALDLSTPQQSLATFLNQIRQGNHETTYQCLLVDSKRPTTLMDATIDWNLAHNRVIRNAEKAFGDGAQLHIMNTMDDVAITLALLPEPIIDGDNAYFEIDIPGAMVDLIPEKYKSDLNYWMGSKMKLQKVSDEWKFDIDHSIHADVMIRTNQQVATADQQREIIIAYAKVYDQVAEKIKSGEIKNQKEALKVLDTSVKKMFAQMKISDFYTNILPVKEK